MLLLTSGAIDGRTTQSNYPLESARTKNIVSNIKNFFNEQEIEYITEIPLYKSMILESILIGQISQELSNLLISIVTSESTIRLTLLKETLFEITILRERFSRKSSREWIRRNYFGTADPEAIKFRNTNSNNYLLENLFFSRTWQELLTNLLIVKIRYLNPSPDYEIKFTKEEILEIQKRYAYNSTDKKVYIETKDYDELNSRITNILDTNDPIEEELSNLIKMFLDKKKNEKDMYNNIPKELSNFMQTGYSKNEKTFSDLIDDLNYFCTY